MIRIKVSMIQTNVTKPDKTQYLSCSTSVHATNHPEMETGNRQESREYPGNVWRIILQALRIASLLGADCHPCHRSESSGPRSKGGYLPSSRLRDRKTDDRASELTNEQVNNPMDREAVYPATLSKQGDRLRGSGTLRDVIDRSCGICSARNLHQTPRTQLR